MATKLKGALVRKGEHLSLDDLNERLNTYLRTHEKCQISCPVYNICHFQYLSTRRPDQQCQVREMLPKIRHRIINLFIAGEEGVFDEIERTLFQYAVRMDASDNLKIIKDYLELLYKFHAVKYGNKIPSAADLQQLNVIINAREGKKDPIIDIEAKNTPVVVPLETDDPESLLNSNPAFIRQLVRPKDESDKQTQSS